MAGTAGISPMRSRWASAAGQTSRALRRSRPGWTRGSTPRSVSGKQHYAAGTIRRYAVRFSPAVVSIDVGERETRQAEPLDGAAPRRPRRSVAEWAAAFAQL